MKTEVAKAGIGEVKAAKSMEERTLVQGPRKSLHPLQKAAGDKENLVGAGRLGSDMPTSKDKLLVASANDKGSVKKLKISKSVSVARVVTVEDLTNERPSNAYWQELCENQRAALDVALTENRELKDRIRALEEENEQCRIILDETKALVDALREMIESPDSASSEEDTPVAAPARDTARDTSTSGEE